VHSMEQGPSQDWSRSASPQIPSSITESAYRFDDRGSIPGRGKGFFLQPLCPDQL
jgi:hypothetical protein